ncbi:excinuclease ABC subunit UvrA [Caniella muris]|uniref:excinuclease ABC subunit UvrA n=1 Tax=Caniella muris TaxID=2941502 RepID=UPI00203DE3AA|nr:excinuclease ABC subunit UvrA [Caniella muris]
MTRPAAIEVRGARVHNLKDIDVDIPLGELVGVAGLSGSGKSSLALGVLWAEGSRRYLDGLSTHTRRRIAQTARADVDDVRHVPAALALRQRPGVPDVRSTFGTSTELLNYLRLMFSRLSSHRCPNGHLVPPSQAVALDEPIVCPVCGESFLGPGAEDLSFNAGGACPTCGGTGVVREVDMDSLVPDGSKTLEEGAVAPWRQLMWSLMAQVAGEMGVRTDVPYDELTDEEKRIVLDGPAEKRHILYKAKGSDTAAELDFTYYSAKRTVENALAKVKDDKGLARVSKFLTEAPCPDCGGTRLSKAARSPEVDGIDLAQACEMTLEGLADWVPRVPGTMPDDMVAMARSITDEMRAPMERLLQLGLGYLTLDRASSTLSTGERQRVALARAVRSRCTGVLYVLDEPSIGLHAANVEGLLGVVDDLLDDGNSVVLVDHDVRVLAHADHLVEMGPGSGADGGRVVCQGTVAQVEADPASRIGPFLSGAEHVAVRTPAPAEGTFDRGAVRVVTEPLHTVRALDVSVPVGRLTCVTGMSGSGKTTLVLEELVPALRAAGAGLPLPESVDLVEPGGIGRVDLIDATPIGANVRSTVGTYSGVLDALRREFAKTDEARALGLKAGDFSYNTGSLRCPACDGCGQVSLDVQFLPDVDVECPACHGSRYAPAADAVHDGGGRTLPQLMALTVDELLDALDGPRAVRSKLETLHDLGLGYLTLGEATPALSGGEAQRLKLASEMRRDQTGALFVFDEPTIGLHPLDVASLLGVLQGLVDHGATVLVIEHDLDVIANADYVVDLGPGGGERGGTVVVAGSPAEVAACPESVTGRFLARELDGRGE